MTFGELFREMRERAGLTQAALAKKARLPLRTVQQWEQGRRSPVSPGFFRAVEALGASADEFRRIEVAERKAKPLARSRKGK